MSNKKKTQSTAVIFRHDKNGQNIIHTIHGDRIHQRVARWMKRNGLTMDNHDYYVTTS